MALSALSDGWATSQAQAVPGWAWNGMTKPAGSTMAPTRASATSHVLPSFYSCIGSRESDEITGLSRSPTAASFIRPTRRSDPSQSFLSALHEKYASDTGQYAGGPDAQIVTFGGGKVAQEMGFDKIRKQQSKLEDLKFVILDGMRISRARDEGEGKISEICPSITQLDMSRCLWESMDGVVEVCGELPNLRKLALRYETFLELRSWMLTNLTVGTVSGRYRLAKF